MYCILQFKRSCIELHIAYEHKWLVGNELEASSNRIQKSAGMLIDALNDQSSASHVSWCLDSLCHITRDDWQMIDAPSGHGHSYLP